MHLEQLHNVPALSAPVTHLVHNEHWCGYNVIYTWITPQPSDKKCSTLQLLCLVGGPSVSCWATTYHTGVLLMHIPWLCAVISLERLLNNDSRLWDCRQGGTAKLWNPALRQEGWNRCCIRCVTPQSPLLGLPGLWFHRIVVVVSTDMVTQAAF